MSTARMSARNSPLLTLAMLATSLLLAVALYPAALALVLMADTLVGDAEFLRQIMGDSKRHAVTTIIADWGRALPVLLGTWVALRLAAKLRYAKLLMTVVGLTSLLLIVLAFVPPYLPMIFGALLLMGTLFSLAFDWLLRRLAI